MKFSIVFNGGSVMAEASNVNELIAKMQGREWVLVSNGNQAIHVPQILAIVEVVTPVGELVEKKERSHD